jgi:hypothetical protein
VWFVIVQWNSSVFQLRALNHMRRTIDGSVTLALPREVARCIRGWKLTTPNGCWICNWSVTCF